MFQSHSTANLLQFGEKLISRSEVNKNADVGVNAIGEHRVKTSEIANLRGRFCFHIFIMAQNNNKTRKALMVETSYDGAFIF